MEAAQSNYNQAQDELTRAQTRLASLNGSPDDHARELVLTAPQNGIVTTLAVAPGAQVSDPTATLMTVTNVDRVFVTANVAEGDIGKASIGTDVDIVLTAHPGQTLHGKISEINAIVEPDTRRQKIRIAFANGDGQLMPNMYATVRLAIRLTGAVSVPQSALLMNNDSLSVFVELRPWIFQRRPIAIGDETDTTVQVLRGLKAGDRVVVRGGVLLND
jgi:cobalt-zinc-cadmium efflux system membrane fusion protein